MADAKYDRLRRLQDLDSVLARFARKPFRPGTYTWLRDTFRVGRIRTRLILVLWELPASLQVEFCSTLARRALPAVQLRHPKLTSIRDFLNPEWIRETIGPSGASENSRWEQLGYELDDLNKALHEQSPRGGDELLYSAVVELWHAFEPDASAATITSACVYCATLAIRAEQYDAWEDMDPEAAQYVRNIHARARREGSVVMRPEGATMYRIPEADPAAQAIWFAGWDAAVTWLRSAQLDRYDEVKDRIALANAVRRSRTSWKRFT